MLYNLDQMVDFWGIFTVEKSRSLPGTSDAVTWQISDSALPLRARPDTGLKAVAAEIKHKSRIRPQCGEVHEWQVVVECPADSDASDLTWFGYIDGDLADSRYEDARDGRGI